MSQTETFEKTRDILTGIAAAGVLFLTSVSLPIISFFSSVFTPLPVTIYRLKLGRYPGIIIPLVMVGLIAMILGAPSPDFFLFTGLMVFGFLLGECLENGYSIEKTICYACGILLAVGFAGMFFYSLAKETDVLTLVSLYVDKNLELIVPAYEKLGMPQESIDLFKEALPRIKYVVVRLFPSLMVSTVLFVGWANILVVKSILLKKGFTLFEGDRPLNEWRSPDMLVWGVIGSGLVLLVVNSGVRLIGVNVLIVLLMVYLFQGLAIISYLFERKNFPVFLKILLYAIIALNQILVFVLIGIGFFDVWMDFRARITPLKTDDE